MTAIPLGLPPPSFLSAFCDDGDCGETCHNHYDIAFICCATLLQFMHPLKNFFVLLHFHILKTLDKELSFLHGELMIPLQQGSDRDLRT